MPRKVFEAFDVLTASDVNTYLSNETTLTNVGSLTYTVTPTDRYKILSFNNGIPATVTISTTTAFQAGERVDILRDGSGTLTINRSGVEISLFGRGGTATSYTIGTRYDVVTILCVAANSYRVIGNATAV
jgi:hypothetical protein